jgi:diguanylate cyclase (GGDEF)-like protein
VLRRSRRRAATPHLPSAEEIGDVMAFLQRLAEASGVAGVGTLVATETRLLAEADGAILFTGPRLTTVAGSAGDIAWIDRGSAFDRAVQTAQPVRLGGATAQLYVPVVHRGTVVGVLAASRSARQPFTQAEQDRLLLLGPHLGSTLARAVEQDSTRQLAFVDGLTRVANRRRLDHDLPLTLQGWLAAGQPVAFAMVDVDHFKAFNDRNGHPLGDEALRAVARVISRTVRDQDVVYRYGGEEFSVLLPGASLEEAAVVAERIRVAVAEGVAVRGGDGVEQRLTVSVGVSLASSTDAARLIAAADGALFEAKHRGRNRVVVRPSV